MTKLKCMRKSSYYTPDHTYFTEGKVYEIESGDTTLATIRCDKGDEVWVSTESHYHGFEFEEVQGDPLEEVEQDKATETYDYLMDESGGSSCGVSCGTWEDSSAEEIIQDVKTFLEALDKGVPIQENQFGLKALDTVSILGEHDGILEDGLFDVLSKSVESDGGPSAYYDLQPDWVTKNDEIEYRSTHQWKEHSFHLGNVEKATTRWGNKGGTSKPYDARKIIYSGLRVLLMLCGKVEVRRYLQELLDDPQFKDT